MPVNKSALLRYRVIDACLKNSNHKFPKMDFIVQKIEDQLDISISDSMFSKDIQQMKKIYGAPIKFDRYYNGYCYTEPDFSIMEFPLTHEEIEALDYSTALLHQLKGTRLFDQFENAINKVIEGYRISKIIGKSESQILQVEEPTKTEGSQWMERLLKSIIEKNALTVYYKGFGKAEKVHQLSPYLVKEYRNRWYVVGFSNLIDKIIVLAFDRISKISRGESRYISTPEFCPQDFFKYSLGITQVHGTKPEKVILSFTPMQAQYVLSQPLHHSQRIIIDNSNEVELELELYITQELIMTILGYGENVKVISPGVLRERIKVQIEKMKNFY